MYVFFLNLFYHSRAVFETEEYNIIYSFFFLRCRKRRLNDLYLRQIAIRWRWAYHLSHLQVFLKGSVVIIMKSSSSAY
jgi:hypothetical protein